MTETDKDFLIEKLRASNRFWKIVAVTTSSVLGFLLLLSSAAIAIQWRQAKQEQRMAVAARDEARAAFIHAQEAVRKSEKEEP